MKNNNYIFFLGLLLFISSCSQDKDESLLLAGCYNESGEKGMSLFNMNQKDGTLKLVSESDAGPNPSYFCISKERGLIYAANEVMDFRGGKGGGVTTLQITADGVSLQKVNEIAVPNGSPCFISLSPDGDFLFLANYTGGSIAVIKLGEKGIPDRITDSIRFEPEGEKISHAHMISFDPAGKRVYLTDLGLDHVVIYNFDSASGKLQSVQNGIIKLAKGSGPRHFVFNSEGTTMYVICELNSTIAVFNVDNEGLLDSLQVVTTLKEGFSGQSFCAEIHISKNGEFLYGSNRGENTIVTFRIGPDGLLKLVGRTSCGGDWPRNFTIDSSGKFILVGNQKSGGISVFSIDENTGFPVEPGKGYKISTPACLKFLQ
jgi:6-phosphogluconolactonase